MHDPCERRQFWRARVSKFSPSDRPECRPGVAHITPNDAPVWPTADSGASHSGVTAPQLVEQARSSLVSPAAASPAFASTGTRTARFCREIRGHFTSPRSSTLGCFALKVPGNLTASVTRARPRRLVTGVNRTSTAPQSLRSTTSSADAGVVGRTARFRRGRRIGFTSLGWTAASAGPTTSPRTRALARLTPRRATCAALKAARRKSCWSEALAELTPGRSIVRLHGPRLAGRRALTPGHEGVNTPVRDPRGDHSGVHIHTQTARPAAPGPCRPALRGRPGVSGSQASRGGDACARRNGLSRAAWCRRQPRRRRAMTPYEHLPQNLYARAARALRTAGLWSGAGRWGS